MSCDIVMKNTNSRLNYLHKTHLTKLPGVRRNTLLFKAFRFVSTDIRGRGELKRGLIKTLLRACKHISESFIDKNTLHVKTSNSSRIRRHPRLSYSREYNQ